ncbi:MAG TPA: carboxypeptidase regulatory-like domain-containing protein [Terriglobales bacterium]|nr:carboxypeptidase regulatory-like domain-containing protein [Terriglobales bacterium]
MARLMNIARWMIVLVAMLLLSLTCVAQLDTGTITGIVQDKTGAVLSDATVKVTNTKTGRTWDLKTGSLGEYSVPALPVGPYQVEVSRSGFKTGVVSDIFLNTSQTVRADLKLEIGAAAEQLTVTAEQATVNTTTSDLGAAIGSTAVTNLPLNGRDFTSLLALVPGSVTTAGFGQTSLGGYETSLAGVNILLDGTDATRIDVNATSTQLGRQESRISRASVDSIQEFRVLSGVYSAEYGRSMGDIVNVITKSGGNTVHGNVFEFLRNDAMDAKNYFNTTGEKSPLRLNQFGGNVGGPVIKNKLFYFVNYEGVRQVVNVPATTTVLNSTSRASAVASMQPVISAIPLPNRPGAVTYVDPLDGLEKVNPYLGFYSGLLENRLREDTGSIKVDFTPSSSDSFALRYNISDSYTSTQYGFAAGQVSPSSSRNHLAKISWTHTFRPNLLNELGVALNRPQTDSLGGGGDFPIFQCSTFWGCNGGNNFGATPGPALFSNRRPQHSISFTNTTSWVKGRNTIRFGFDIRKNVTHDALDPQQFLSYANANDFLTNGLIQVDTLGHTMVGVENSNLAFFMQDDIRLTSRFTMNLGLRYEYNTVLSGPEMGNFDIASLKLQPKGIDLYKPDRNNFAPRVGFAYDLLGDGKTVLRGGAGIFFNPLLTGAALSLAGNYQQSFSVNLFDLFDPNFSCNPPLNWGYPVNNPLPTCNKVLPASVNSLDPNMRDTYSGHWSLGVQRELVSNTVLEATYVGNRGIKLPAGAAYAGMELNYSPFGGKQLSNDFGQIRRLGNFLDSNYNALQVSVRRHMAAGLNLDANYTWSHEIDDAVNILTGAFQNSHNPKGDYGSGDIDVRHNFTLGLVYDIPKFVPGRLGSGWQVSSMFATRTGLPVNIALAAPFLGIDQLRPNLVPGASLKPANYTVPGDQYNQGARQFNKDAFSQPAAGTFGNTPRNYGRGPGYHDIDLALQKSTKLNERLSLLIRGEMFNLFNHPNFANPVGYMDSQDFGRSTSTIGNHVGIGTSRQAQVAMKLVF